MQFKYKSSAVFPALLVLGSMSANAADWRNEPFVSSSIRYDDNVRFVNANTESSAGATVDAGVAMVNESETTTTIFQPRLSFSGYSSEGDLNSSDQFLDFTTKLNGERANLDFAIKYARDSAVSTELEDTGVVNAAIRRDLLRISPGWEYRFSPKNSVQLGYTFRSVDWDEKEVSGLEENNINETWGAYKHRLSEHDDLRVKVYQKDFEAPEDGYESTTVGAEVGFFRRFSEVNRAELAIGGWNADVNNPGGSSENASGGSIAGAIVHHDETTDYRVSLSQLVAPSSAGQIRQDRRLAGYYDYKLNPRLHWGIDGTYIQIEKIGELSEDRDRDYFVVRPFLSWEWKPKVTLSSSVRISSQEYKDTGETADRNELLFTISYGKPRVAY